MPEPWELLPGRSADGHANQRINLDLTAAAGLLERSTLLTCEAIEFEPSLPSAVLQFDLIRSRLRKELPQAPFTRGCFGKLHRYVGGGTGDEAFQWSYADANHQAILKRWCREHVQAVSATTDMAAGRLVEQGVLPGAVAGPRVAELLQQR